MGSKISKSQAIKKAEDEAKTWYKRYKKGNTNVHNCGTEDFVTPDIEKSTVDAWKGKSTYGDDGELGQATFFDAETYGRDALVPGFAPRHGDYEKNLGTIDRLPVSTESRESLRKFYSTRTDVLKGRNPEERERFLRGISYTGFVREFGGLTEEAANLFINATHGYAGVGAESLSAAEGEGAGLPMVHLLGRVRSSPGASAAR